MTKKEYIKLIKDLPPEKIQIISDSFHEASLLINKAECQLFDTPLRDIEISSIKKIKTSYLWLTVYKCYKMFDECLTPKQ